MTKKSAICETPAMTQRAQASIDLGALRHNLARVRAAAPGSAVFAALKADAYGHGASRVAAALADADGFAVASLDEALALRFGGCPPCPIMLLSQPLTPADCALCAEHDLQPVLFADAQLDAFAAYRGPAVRVWVKLDSGMHRLGFAPERAGAIHDRLAQRPGVALAGWMTHLACADDRHSPATAAQVERFNAALTGLPGQRSIANSAGILAWPQTHADVVRPGIMLYGASPLLDADAQSLGLRPVMTLHAPLISVQHVAAGEAVGYGATWRAPENMPIGIAAIGYGDGYPRHAPNGTPVLVNGAVAPLAGRVSMDMIAVDLRGCPDAAPGDSAVLWGEGLPADRVARAAGTIAYELFCQLTPRVRFTYLGIDHVA